MDENDGKDKNWEPKKDPDIINGSFSSAFGTGMVGLIPGAALEKPADPKVESKRERRRRKRELSAGKDGLGIAELPAKEKSNEGRESMPKQNRGESARDYAKRVNEHLRIRLQEENKKLATTNSRDKKRKRAEARRKKAIAKAERKNGKVEDDGLFRKAERAAFGDVVQRPPVMSADAMKSQAKLKAGAAGDEGLQGRPNGVPPEMQDYAAKVREAYAALKKRRGQR